MFMRKLKKKTIYTKSGGIMFAGMVSIKYTRNMNSIKEMSAFGDSCSGDVCVVIDHEN